MTTPGVATFDWSTWELLYPELISRGVTQPYATALFNGPAGLLLDNTECSRVQDLGQRGYMLGLIVAHIAWLSGPGSSGAVGRVSQASQGSVSASLDYGQVTQSEAYWVQSPYGALYWQATAAYRTGVYVPAPPTPYTGPLTPYGYGGGRQPGQW